MFGGLAYWEGSVMQVLGRWLVEGNVRKESTVCAQSEHAATLQDRFVTTPYLVVCHLAVTSIVQNLCFARFSSFVY